MPQQSIHHSASTDNASIHQLNNFARVIRNTIENEEVNSAVESGSDEGASLKKQRRRKKRSGQQKNKRTDGDKQKALDLNKQADNMNIKRSVEIKNGQALRGMNTFYKTSNAIDLHSYKGTFGLIWFIYDLIMQADHVILIVHFLLAGLSGYTLEKYSYLIATTFLSFAGTGLMNILADKKLKEATDNVNCKPIEKFDFSRKAKKFVVSDWASLQCGDIIKLKMN